MGALGHPASHGRDPWTSFAAAGVIAPYQKTIALKVLYWHRTYWESGLIDDELRVLMRSTIQTDSSHRKRRTELTQAGYLEDSGLTRLNRDGNPEVVWRVTELGRTGRWPISKKEKRLKKLLLEIENWEPELPWSGWEI